MHVAGDLRLVRDLPGEADALDEPPQILRVGGEVEVDQRLDLRIGARKLQAAARVRAFERHGQPDRERGADRCHRLLAADASHVDVAEHDLLHVIELPGVGCGVADHHLRERGLRVAAAGLGDQQQPGDRVIGETRANAGKVRDGLDAQASQRSYGADARAKQDRRRADGAGGQSDAPPAELYTLALASKLHADRPVAADQDPVDQAVRLDGEVGPVPGRQQVGDRR